MEREILGPFTSGFAPRGYPRRTPRRGRSSRTGPGTTPPTSAEPPSTSTTQLMRPRVARRWSSNSCGPGRHHRQDELTGMPQGFVTGEARRDPLEHRRVLGPPPIGVYAMNRGDRGQFYCLHKHRTMPRSPLWPAQTRPEPLAPIYAVLDRSGSFDDDAFERNPSHGISYG